MKNNKVVTLDPKVQTAAWKLAVAIEALTVTKRPVPLLPSKLHATIQQGKFVTEGTTLSAYQVCCSYATPNGALVKQIDRLGHLRFELLMLLSLAVYENADETVKERVKTALAYTPKDEAEYIKCEAGLRAAIHAIIPEERNKAKVLLRSKSFQVKRGELSNHVYRMVKLGRECTNPSNQEMVETLIEQQLDLLDRMVNTTQGLTKQIEKKIMKVVHWLPKDIQDAKKIHMEANQLLAAAG